MIRVSILGASGYTGVECVRLLQHHPNVEIIHLFANKSVGLSTYLTFGQTSLPEYYQKFDVALLKDIDCLIIALPHTTVHPLMPAIMESNVKVIDLSADFRLKSNAEYKTYYNQNHSCEYLLNQSIYGIPELFDQDIATSRLIANPGCYAIASILALKPLADKQIIDHVVIDAKSGVSGAGKKADNNFSYCEVNGHLKAYGTNTHRHMAECYQLCGDISLVFSPHLVPMSRGILASCYITLKSSISQDSLDELYQQLYQDQPFIVLNKSSETPSTQQVVGSNNCAITCKILGDKQVVIFSAIDNLIKGAAGNAIQNMNILFNYPQQLGLPTVPFQV